MSSRGTSENKQLQQNLEEQLDRLVAQLGDLEDCRDELDAEEYEEMHKDTVEQLTEFQDSLSRFSKGDMTLVDSINAMQLAIQAAISEAFKTPEVIRMFAKKQPDQLRQKLTQIERDHKISSMTFDDYTRQKVEVLTALQKLGETLKSSEEQFLETNSSTAMKHFDQITDESNSGEKAMELAYKAIQ